jgi:murein L,D-transpeptidase YcbB/YkuD
LNLTGLEKFKRAAITLDKYKQLPDTLPPRYIWVNLPEYKLYLRDHDSLILESRIICGKPVTPTPLITSSIYEMIAFPTWTVPESIIKKEMLPALKRNPRYLEKKGMYLLNKKGEKVRADTINWKKYKQGIPFRIQQGSGDDNSLGVFKFNFHNPFDVYMHDTDQRHLFRNSKRAFSHGCVRVQEWSRLATEVLRYDSLLRKAKDTVPVLPDSVISLIASQKHCKIPVKNRIPVFFRYFSSSASEGKIQFFDDIYGVDKDLRNRFFASKAILPFVKKAL